MRLRSSTLPLAWPVIATACSGVLGVEDDSELVPCTTDGDCVLTGQMRCIDHRCEGSGGILGAAGIVVSDAGKPDGTGGTSIHSAGSRVVPISGGTGAVATASGGIAGTLSSSGATASSGIAGTLSSSGATAQSGSAGGSSVIGGATASGGTSASGGVSSVGGTPSAGTSSVTLAGRTSNAGGSLLEAGGDRSAGAAGSPLGDTHGGTAGAAIGGIAAGAGNCTPGEHRCRQSDDNPRDSYWQTCNPTHTWENTNRCATYCSELRSGCVAVKSCAAISACANGINCCNSLLVPGGGFNRSILYGTSPEDDLCTDSLPCPAQVSPFFLDAYEVTVERFRVFVTQYPQSLPSEGAGHLRQYGAETGWQKAWENVLPKSRQDLEAALSAEDVIDKKQCTYTTDSVGNDDKPVTCVSWYLAFAFCASDGGRLPTEAEWNFAAVGGDQYRYYPWSSDASDTNIDYYHAIYDFDDARTSPELVGSAYKGYGRWGQYDLAGNAFEWMLDAYAASYVTPCNDCANTQWTLATRVLRGGSFASLADNVKASTRNGASAGKKSERFGFRCARDL